MHIVSKVLAALALSSGLAGAASADEPLFSGTAFAVSDNGWLLTNAHVVDKCTRIEVKGLGPADLPKIDATNDLAAVKVTPAKSLTPLRFRKNPVRLGEDIVAIGFPLSGLLSDSIKVTTGNVNALAGIANDTRYIQISTPIQPGNSGGPVVDKDGLLIGVTSATLSKDVADKIGITAQNVNFAIRSSVAELFLQSQGIAYQAAETPANPTPLATADIADKITPSVYPVLCYGKPVETTSEAKVTPEPNTEAKVGAMPDGVAPQQTLIDAGGYDAIGFDFYTLKDVSYATCKTACANNSQCMAFTYNLHHNYCFLKSDVVAMIRNGDATSAYAAQKSASIVFSNFTVYRDMDFPGGDYLRIKQSNYSQCLLACIQDNVCRAFAFVPRKKECWLKSQLGQVKSIDGVELGVK